MLRMRSYLTRSQLNSGVGEQGNDFRVMQNPWVHLSSRAPYVLPSDRRFVDMFNDRASPGLHIDTTLLPEPFVGRPDAPVVLLGLNPGWGPSDAEAHRRSVFRKRVFACLRHEISDAPFYYLTPGADGPGERWWRRSLRRLLEDVSRETLARHLLCVEYFPYTRGPSVMLRFGYLRSHIALRSSKPRFDVLQ